MKFVSFDCNAQNTSSIKSNSKISQQERQKYRKDGPTLLNQPHGQTTNKSVLHIEEYVRKCHARL